MDAESFDWAHDAFVALNATDPHDPTDPTLDFNASTDKWLPLTTTRPSLPTQASIERHGQITPPEDLSPTSMGTDQLPSELPWPEQHQLQARHDVPPQQTQSQSASQSAPNRPAKRRRTAANQAQTNSNQASHNTNLAQLTTGADPQPPKRKRGRPKSQPQTIEAYSQDGFPFPVSTARQSHLEKNRVAAHKCRQRRKEYIDGLEARGRVASSKNKSLKENVAILREEILQLKNEVLRHAGCNFWAVDEYLARCAGDLLGMDGPQLVHRKHDTTFSPSSKTENEMDVKEDRDGSPDSLPSQATHDSPPDFDDYFLDSLDQEMEGPDT